MELQLGRSQSVRVVVDRQGHNFVDLSSVGYEALAIDLFSAYQYIEIRKKEYESAWNSMEQTAEIVTAFSEINEK